MLSRKYYQQMADVIKQQVVAHDTLLLHALQGTAVRDAKFSEGKMVALKITADNLADMCQRDNPRFNRTKFIEACGF